MDVLGVLDDNKPQASRHRGAGFDRLESCTAEPVLDTRVGAMVDLKMLDRSAVMGRGVGDAAPEAGSRLPLWRGLREPTRESDLPRHVAQRPLENLAGTGDRERVDEGDRPWDLVSGDLLPAEVAQLVLSRGSPGR